MPNASGTPDRSAPAAIVFDWDDTVASLHEFERDVALPAVKRLLTGKGYSEATVNDWCADYISDGGGMLTGSMREARAFAACTDQERLNIRGILKSKAFSTAIPGMPAVVSLVRRLNVPCAVASNSLRSRLDWNMVTAGMSDQFDAVVSSTDVGMRKPDPAIINEALDLLGITESQRSSVIYVGNRAHDVEAAVAAGVRAWVVGFGIPRAKVPPQYAAILALPGVEYFSEPAALQARIQSLAGPQGPPARAL